MVHKIGVGTSSIDWDDLEAKVGEPLQARRLYRQGTLKPVLDAKETESVQAGRLVVVSWQPLTVEGREQLVKGEARDMIKGWLDKYPPDANVVTIMGHEPTAHDKVHIWPNSSTYMQGCDQFVSVLDELNPEREKKIRFWGCHIPWHARTGEVNLAWIHERWRGVAWDGYDWWGRCPDPANIYKIAFDLTESADKRNGIGEFGSDIYNQDTDKLNTGRAEWITSVRKYSEEHGLAFVLYWNNSNWLLKTDAEFKALAP